MGTSFLGTNSAWIRHFRSNRRRYDFSSARCFHPRYNLHTLAHHGSFPGAGETFTRWRIILGLSFSRPLCLDNNNFVLKFYSRKVATVLYYVRKGTLGATSGYGASFVGRLMLAIAGSIQDYGFPSGHRFSASTT